MLCRLPLLPRPRGSLADRLGPVRTLWPAPGTLLAELQQELETAVEFASSSRRLVGSSSPGGEPGRSTGQGPAQPFAVRQDVQGFAPEELRVKLTGRKLLLTGRKETQREDGQGACSYKYEVLRREWDVPLGVDTARLACSLSTDGQLRIDAPGLPPPATPERNVPVQLSTAGSPAAPAEPHSEDSSSGRARG